MATITAENPMPVENGRANGHAANADELDKKVALQPASTQSMTLVDEKHRSAWEEFRREAYATIGTGAGAGEEGKEDKRWFDDVTLARFFRARSYNVARALDQLRATDAWRRKINLDHLYETFDVSQFETSRTYYTRWTGRRDLDGRPLYVFRIASLDKKRQKAIFAEPEEERYNRIVVLTEFLSRFLTRFVSDVKHASPESKPSDAPAPPITSITTIVDLASVSLMSLLALRSHLQQSITLGSAHYPETLDTIAVVNAPSFFPTVWSWVRLCFDEGTRRKIHILGPAESEAAKKELRTLVALADLPRVYGGEMEWTFDDAPNLDDEIKAKLGVQELPTGPLDWNREQQEAVLLGTGRET